MKFLTEYLLENLKKLKDYLILETNEKIYDSNDAYDKFEYPFGNFSKQILIFSGDHTWLRQSERIVSDKEIITTILKSLDNLLEVHHNQHTDKNHTCVLVNKNYNDLNVSVYIEAEKSYVIKIIIKTVYKGSDFRIGKNQPVIQV